MRYVEVWLDHPVLACGLRRFVVTSEGRKWVTLLDPVTLRQGRVERADFERAHPIECPTKGVARRLEERLRTLKRCGAPAAAGNQLTGTLRRVRVVLDDLAVQRTALDL